MAPCSSPCHGCHPEALGSRQGSELMVAFSPQVEPCHVEKAVSRMWAVGESVYNITLLGKTTFTNLGWGLRVRLQTLGSAG